MSYDLIESTLIRLGEQIPKRLSLSFQPHEADQTMRDKTTISCLFCWQKKLLIVACALEARESPS